MKFKKLGTYRLPNEDSQKDNGLTVAQIKKLSLVTMAIIGALTVAGHVHQDNTTKTPDNATSVPAAKVETQEAPKIAKPYDPLEDEYRTYSRLYTDPTLNPKGADKGLQERVQKNSKNAPKP